MSIQTIAPAATTPGGHNSYETGYLEGQLAAVDKTPSSIVMSRAAAAEPHDLLWAYGYNDGFIDQTNHNAALREKKETHR